VSFSLERKQRSSIFFNFSKLPSNDLFKSLAKTSSFSLTAISNRSLLSKCSLEIKS
jgi:hypothetical protein